MKPRALLVLVLLFAALIGAYWFMGAREASQLRTAIEARALFDFTGEDVQSIEIERIGEAPIAAERATDTWRITKPHPAIRPFPLLWDRMAEKLSAFESARTITTQLDDASQYGLEPPALVVRARIGGETGPQNVVLRFGELAPTQNHRYTQGSDGAVFLLHKDAYFELNRSLDELRHRFLVARRDAELLEIEYARIWRGGAEVPPPGKELPEVGQESVTVHLKRPEPDAPWRLSSPVEAVADQEAVNGFVTAVRFALVRGHIDAPGALAQYGLDPPIARVTIVDAAQPKPQTVFFGDIDDADEEGGLFAMHADGPGIFLVEASILSHFPALPDMYRERRLFSGQVTDLARLRYRGPQASFVLEKAGDDGWRVAEPAIEHVDQAAVSAFLAGLKNTGGAIFPETPPQDHGLDHPAIEMVLEHADSEHRDTIVLAPDAKNSDFYAALQDSGTLTLVTRESAQWLDVAPGRFVSKEMLRFPKPLAARIELSLDGAAYVLEKVHGKWIVNEPPAKRLANQNDATALLDALTPLIANDVLPAAAKAGPAFGLGTPTLRVHIVLRDPDNADETRIGPFEVGAVHPEDSALRYATVANRKEVFIIGQERIDAVREALRGVQDQ